MNENKLDGANYDVACCDNVNGFYGPGAMLGWYLTLAGCMVSWTLHPERKKKDSINADMLTFLLLPLTAAAQLFSFSRQIDERYVTVRFHTDEALQAALQEQVANFCVCQRRCAIEAPAKVVFAYLNLAIVFLYPLSATHHLRRGAAILVVMLTCLASEWYIYDFALHNTPGLTLPSPFLRRKYFLAPICTIVVVSDIGGLIFRRFSLLSGYLRRPKKREELENQTPLQSQMAGEDWLDRNRLWAIRFGMIWWGVLMYLFKDTGWTFFADPRVRFWTVDWIGLFFPASPYNIGNIEQATAAVGGGVVLGFNLYSVAVWWWKQRQERIAEERKKLELLTMQQDRTWHGHDHDQEDTQE